jgi:hypothetical protein
MHSFTRYLTAAAAIGGISAPLAAQVPYPYGYPQQQGYPQQAYPGYNGQYGYNQGYGSQNPVGQIIDQLLGNRYNVTDRQAVSQCANAAMTQAQAQFGGYNQGYGQQYGQGYNRNVGMRVTSITDVQRRNNGLRVTGTMSSGYGGGQYGGQYGYQNRGYGDVSFRCNVDYRGAVTNVRIGRNDGLRG